MILSYYKSILVVKKCLLYFKKILVFNEGKKNEGSLDEHYLHKSKGPTTYQASLGGTYLIFIIWRDYRRGGGETLIS